MAECSRGLDNWPLWLSQIAIHVLTQYFEFSMGMIILQTCMFKCIGNRGK